MPPKRKTAPAASSKAAFLPPKRYKRTRQETKDREKYLEAEDEDMIDRHFQMRIDSRYTGIYPPPTPQRRPRQHRWRWTGPKPLTDPKMLPPLWNCAEPDLDDNDIDGQIERCHERIEENIMPHIFQERLARFEARKEERHKIMATEPGLDWETVQRVKELIEIEKHLKKDGDPEEEIPNIVAIISAYRAKDITWEWGKITYWAKGKQLNENPVKFSWDEFERKSEAAGGKGFWVEGILGGPEPDDGSTLGAVTSVPGTARFNFKRTVPCLLNLPGCTIPYPIDFMDDTGAFMSIISENDLYDLEYQSGKRAKVAGYKVGYGVSGPLTMKIVELMITLPHPTQPDKTRLPFFKIFVGIKDLVAVAGGTSNRLLGPWLRQVIYTATSPDGEHRMYLLDNKEDFKHVPKSTIPIARRWIHDLSFLDIISSDPSSAVAAAAGGAGR